MEKGGPSPLSPLHYCGLMWSSQRGPPPLIRGSGVGGAALPPSPGPVPSLLHLGRRPGSSRLLLVQRGQQGRASPPDLGPSVKPCRAPHPSPPAIQPGSASPGDSRPVPESGEARQRLPTASLHRA
ncbi:hypothetical protein NDU88_006614 [Pleurodeles waltl]|uniref:Uncharacterized protein n=1 Tax=Pleurodeles waltl TaxID=8319 RepID=A0AAV7NYL0_PLEWA|nr:hypothetical protein NDU88_006614 [Pleurodeles waltl]